VATPVEVPKLGNTVEECLVSRWAKRKGDTVAEGDLVAEIETDKATFEVNAPVAGTILETYFPEGALAPVFSTLFVIGDSGSAVAPAPPAAIPREILRESEAPRRAAISQPPAAPPAGSPGLSPRARRFAARHNLNPANIDGSGPNGRILEADLRKLHRPGIRDRIARRMRESLATTAQYTLSASADATGLLAVRARFQSSAHFRGVTLNDLIMHCAVEALLDVPALNAEYVDGQVREHADVHLAFACDTPRGLLAPVIRDAHTLAIDELAARARELGDQAVSGAVSPDDLSGATFTVSNLGALGVETFTPLLNPPQVAILGVGAIQLKPVRRSGQVHFIDALSLSLTCDHQVIDGAPGARFLQVIASKIEAVDSLLHHA
jgi:pyruvate dehydrogenase E2 component (dihydrolipoamide acetyltransferase)